MKIYTKTGDKGQTKLFSGHCVSKNDPLIKAYGKVDTLVSFLGYSKALLLKSKKKEFKEIINVVEEIQILCFKTMTDLAATKMNNVERINEDDVKKIENIIDKFWERLPKLKNFIIPGSDVYSASLHISRSVCREIEPTILEAMDYYKQQDTEVNPLTLTLINRISDLLFTLAVYVEFILNKKLTIIKNNKKLK